MNPSQSESFWKSQQQDEMQKWRIPTDHKPTNSHPSPCITYLQHHQQSSLHFSTQLFPKLQTYYQMKSEKEQHFQWTKDKEEQMFDLHQHYGNKWSSIASKLDCRSDNCVKNKYYSTMRKGYRKLNRYITMIRRKRSAPHLSCNKLIKPEFLVKLNAVVDGTYAEKYEVKSTAIGCSQEIQRKLIDLARNETVYEGNLQADFPLQEGLLSNIQEFNRGCKKRKGKRKQKGEEDDGDEESEEQEQIEPSAKVTLLEDKDLKAISTSATTTIVEASKDQDQQDEKPSKNQEVQFPDNLMVEQQKQEKQGKGDNPLFKFDLDVSGNSLDKSNLNYRLFIDSTPTIITTRRFQEQAKYFQDSSYLKVSLSQMNSSYFKVKECPEPVGSFVQSIPQLKDSDKSLYDSVNIKREIQEEAAIDKLQEYNRTRSSNLANRRDNVDLMQSRLSLLLKQKEDNKHD